MSLQSLFGLVEGMAGGWEWCGFRVLCWPRGDPESIRVVRVLRGLLEAQGVVIVLP